jgi:hypothetical protein
LHKALAEIFIGYAANAGDCVAAGADDIRYSLLRGRSR